MHEEYNDDGTDRLALSNAFEVNLLEEKKEKKTTSKQDCSEKGNVLSSLYFDLSWPVRAIHATFIVY